MTKNVRLSQQYITSWKAMGKKLSANGKAFFTYDDPTSIGGESFRDKDIAADPTKVPIYVIPQEITDKYNQLTKPIPEQEIVNYIIRYEGSNATPPTSDIECYGCNEEEAISMSTALADKWIAAGVMEEVI